MTVRIHRLHRRQIVAADLPAVFAFFKSPSNLETITPPWLHFRVRRATCDPVQEGTRITYRLRLGMMPLGWESLITEYQENAFFADEMLRGPYRRWYHRHRFRQTPDGVEIIDRVEYSMPAPPIGELLHPIVRHQLDAIFDYRATRIAQHFGTHPGEPAVDGTERRHHLVLFAHGSSAPQWLAPFERVTTRLRESFGVRVHLAYLERQGPDLGTAIGHAVALGADNVSILPMFLAAGRHVEHDLPELVSRARSTVGIPIQVLPILGDDERFWHLVIDQAHEALGRASRPAGTSDQAGHFNGTAVHSSQRSFR